MCVARRANPTTALWPVSTLARSSFSFARRTPTRPPVVQEALHRARYKFPDRQKIVISRKWGYTCVNPEDHLKLEDKRVLQYAIYSLSSHIPVY